MDRVFETGAVVLAPTAPASPSSGYPTGGNPVGGVPATKPGPWWFHMITEELRAVIAAGGITPDHLVLNQLLQALPNALASRPEMARILAASGYQRLPGGLILQWRPVNVVAGTTLTATFPMAFPSALVGFAAMGVQAGDTATQFISAKAGTALLTSLGLTVSTGSVATTLFILGY